MIDLSQLIRYRIESSSPTQHGQGQVWKAIDLLYDRPVAIKFVRADLSVDQTALLQFQKEAMVGARLGESHPNVVRVHDLNMIDGHFYYVMEWLSGGTLQPFCGRVTFRKAIVILGQISSAVATAHDHGVVHSDVAPLNVLFDGQDTFKLTDFGYLKILDSLLVSRGDRPLHAGGRSPRPLSKLVDHVVDLRFCGQLDKGLLIW